MSVKVAKFGGSSVADGTRIEKIKEIVKKDKKIHYVVVSAPGKRFDNDSKITDILYSCKTHMEQNLPFEQSFQILCDRFGEMQASLKTKINLEKEFNLIRKRMREGASTDYIASRGEYLNGKIIADFLGFDYIDAAKVIKFDTNGKFLEEQTNKALKRELAKHDFALIPGFYGADSNGEIRTFPRGGSDITGALVARAIEAEVYENWTDVSGFLMADPRIVKDPKPIETLSFKELRELSYMGAGVLHEDAIYPARISGIPINIRNTNEPSDKGTMITAEPNKKTLNRVVTGIAGSKDFTVIAIYKNQLTKERGFVRRLAGILEDYDIPLEHLPSGIDTVSVVISNEWINGRIDEIIDEFERQLQPDTMEVFNDIALIATVGLGMSSRLGVSAKLFGALANANINIRMIDQGSSEMNIIVGVKNKDFKKSICAIYDAFVNSPT